MAVDEASQKLLIKHADCKTLSDIILDDYIEYNNRVYNDVFNDYVVDSREYAELHYSIRCHAGD